MSVAVTVPYFETSEQGLGWENCSLKKCYHLICWIALSSQTALFTWKEIKLLLVSWIQSWQHLCQGQANYQLKDIANTNQKPKSARRVKTSMRALWYEACSIFWFSNYIIPLLSCTHCAIANCTSGFVVTSKKYLQVQQESSKVVRSPTESSSLGSSKTKSIQLCMRHIICTCE